MIRRKQTNNNKNESLTETEQRVEPRPITEEMKESYLDYAMSVIVSRALPDVRDGLKPVHRRILYAMWEEGLRHTAKFRKSATVVGSTLGRYHPHGDTAVYDAMARMAQDFSLRYPLINGQGNWGSIDGDSPAAMRYTEARLSAIAEEMLKDIEKNTVDFMPNYDGSHQEPKVLPSLLPNLLLNGTMGIAVGMATNIPPHNLGELCDGVAHLIDNPDATIEDLMQFIKGPDFPTGGIIYNNQDILTAFATGRGGIVIRAKTEIVEEKSNYRIIVSEIPYQVNKATLLEKIAELISDKKLEGVRDIRDESSKDGIRIVFELKRDAYPKKVLNKLFHLTELQTTYHVNSLALVDGILPRVLNLKSLLGAYIEHRKEIVKRRSQYDLMKAKERAHILDGLKIAIANIDRVIATIKKSADRDEAKINLMKKFRLSEAQAIAILEMKLQQLANLERIRVEQELKDKKQLIKDLETLLASPKLILKTIKSELSYLKEKFADPRRTQIVPHGVKEFSAEDLIPNEPTIIILTSQGYIKRIAPTTFKTQERGGKGVMGLTTKEEDIVAHLLSTETHADLLFFTNRGRVFQMKAYDVPPATRTAKGQSIVNFLQLSPNENVSNMLSFKELEDSKFLVMVTKKGLIKKVDIEEFKNVRRSGLIAIKLKTDDDLRWTKPSMGSDDIILVSAGGQSIRFNEKDVRPMGRAAAGVRAMRLQKGDAVIGMDILPQNLIKKNILELLVVMENGHGKRTNLKSYKVQRRGGSGIKTAKITDKTGEAITAFTINSLDEQDLIVISSYGQVIRLPLKSVPTLGRATQGVRIMRFKEEKDKVASVTLV
jgi:DNA gyrase subunit A